jgi:hypothetical protein
MAEPELRRDIPQHERDSMDAADFAGKDKSFPINRPEDVAAAAASMGRAGPGNYSTDELKRRIIAIARRKGAAFVAQPPGGSGDVEYGSGSELGRIWPDSLLVAPGAPHAARTHPAGQEKSRHYPDAAGGAPGGGLGPPPGEA